MGVIFRSFNKQIYEHKRDFKRADINNSLVKNNLETNRNINFKGLKILIYKHNNKKRCKIVKSRIISNYNTIKQTCFVKLSPYLLLMLKKY